MLRSVHPSVQSASLFAHSARVLSRTHDQDLLTSACMLSRTRALVVPRGASILIIREPWIGLILDGHKTLEIRGTKCNKSEGHHIYLALSGGGGVIVGAVTFVACHGPLSRSEYTARAEEHCVAGDALPYGASTYAWEVRSPVRFSSPVAYHHKQGVVVWAKKE